MDKINENFEKILMEKAQKEKSQFHTPISFNKKVEEVLKEIDNLENNKMKKGNKNKIKKYISLAAAFVFLFSIGIIKYTFIGDGSKTNKDMIRSIEYSQSESAGMIESGNEKLGDKVNLQRADEEVPLGNIIDLDSIESIVINDEKITNEENFSDLIYNLKRITLVNSNKDFEESDIKIEIYGEENVVIYMKEKLFMINNGVYEGKTFEVENLQKVLYSLINN